MANLSNINGKFVVEQTTGYVGVGTTDPSYPIEVLNASAEIALNASGGSMYRIQSDSASNFIIRKEGVGDRLVINSAGNSTFAGNINVQGAYSSFNTGGSGTFITNDSLGYPRITITSASAQIGLFRASDGGMYIGGSSGGFRVYNSSFSQKLLIDSGTGNATFAGTVIAPNFSGPGQGLNNLLSLGAYATIPASTGILIATNIITTNYAFVFGTIKLQRFHVAAKQTIEFSATALNTGVVQSFQATSDVAITFKMFNYNGYWHLWFPMPAYYTTATAFINTGEGYQGQVKGFNEVSSITMAAVPSSGVTNSVDVVSKVYVTTETNLWIAKPSTNDIYNSNTGFTGIGTSSPNAKLDIYSTATFNSRTSGINVHRPGSYGQYGSFSYNSDTTYFSSTYSGNGASNYGAFVWEQFNNGTVGREAMRIITNGNVGIGTPTPNNKLSVQVGTDMRMEFWGNTQYAAMQSVNDANSQLKPMRFDSSDYYFVGGDLAIGGVFAPEQKLHVEGRGIFDGAASSDILQIRNDNGGGTFGMTANQFALDLASASAFRIRQGSSVPLYLKSNGNLGIGSTSPAGRLTVEGPVGAAAYNTSNGGIKNERMQMAWYTGQHYSNNTAYTHIKTSLWMGGAPSGNTQYIMGGFIAKSYAYGGGLGYGEGRCMFHNWSGGFASLYVSNSGDWATFMQSPYTSSDGYCVIVLRHNYYSTPQIDFFQEFTGYPWRAVSVTAQGQSSSNTGLY